MSDNPMPAAIPSRKRVSGPPEGHDGKILTVREHVRRHADLVVHRRAAPHERVQLFVDRALAPPLRDRVEDELATTYHTPSAPSSTLAAGSARTVRVLLPAVNLVVDGQ